MRKSCREIVTLSNEKTGKTGGGHYERAETKIIAV